MAVHPRTVTGSGDPAILSGRNRPYFDQRKWPITPLRFYTCPRFHLVQNLSREKCYSAFLFLKASSYRRLKPFSDVFGATSRLVLTQYPSLDQLAELPVEDLASCLHELSAHHLPDPLANARKLWQVAQESLPLDETLALPVQRMLDLTLDHIRFLETQLQQLDDWIAAGLSHIQDGRWSSTRFPST